MLTAPDQIPFGHHRDPSGGGVRLSGGGHGRLPRIVLGRALADHRQASLPLEALDKAIASRGGSLKDLIDHSDRGVQYACRDYALRLSQIGAHASMSRPGTPQDNAKAESFMHTLKAEEVDGKAYRSREDAESKMGAFIDDAYNARRLHSSIGDKPPIEFEHEFRKLRNVKQTNPRPCHKLVVSQRRAQSSRLFLGKNPL